MFQRIAIMGAGSLGTILGAHIAKNRQVDLIDANKAHVDALNKNGAKVIGFDEFTVPVTALTPEEMTGKYDLFIYLAKQLYNKDCLAQMKAHSHDKTIFCTGQNGMPELALEKEFGEKRVLGAPVNWGATYVEPGVSKLTSTVASCSFTLGTMDGSITPELPEVKKILEYMCPVVISENLMGLRWCKLLINATLSGMSTVMGGTFGDVMDDPIAVAATALIGRELVRAVEAEGTRMEPLHLGPNEYDFTEIYAFDNLKEREKTIEKIRSVFVPARALEASMLQDLQKGLKCEIDYINGEVSKLGKKHGVPTPVCDKVIEIVKKLENGESKLGRHNLKEMEFVKDMA